MIRFALVVASVLGFVLTAALGNMMVPLLRELQRAARGTQPDSDAPDSPVPTMGGLCLMVGTLAAVGVGWLAACAAQPSLLGSDRQMTSRLLIALLGVAGPLAQWGWPMIWPASAVATRTVWALACAAHSALHWNASLQRWCWACWH